MFIRESKKYEKYLKVLKVVQFHFVVHVARGSAVCPLPACNPALSWQIHSVGVNQQMAVLYETTPTSHKHRG